MRGMSTFFRWIAGILLVIATFFQVIALYWTVHNGLTATQRWLTALWLGALVLLPAALVLLCLLREKKSWPLVPLVVAVLGTLLALAVALTLQDAFLITSEDAEQGITLWKLLYRHYSSVAAGVLLVMGAVFDLIENRLDRIRRENEEYRSIYDFSGDSIFREDSTLGLDSYVDEKQMPKKRKRSLRAAAKKAGKE